MNDLIFECVKKTLATLPELPKRYEDLTDNERKIADIASIAIGALSFIYQKLEENNLAEENGKMRLIYNLFYDLRVEKNYQLIDGILQNTDEKSLAPVLLIAILTVTAPIKTFLNHRIPFYQRAKEAIVVERGIETTEKLLMGLE